MQNEEKEDFLPYCESCNSCGEPGCCKPTKCLYFKNYAKDFQDQIDSLSLEIQKLKNAIQRLYKRDY